MSTRRPSVQREYQQQVLLRWMSTITYRMITVGAILLVVGLAYLLYALFMLGDQGSYTAADVGRIQGNLTLFGRLALLGAGMVVIGLAWNFLEEEVVGYVLVLLALFFYWGLPFLLGQIGTLPEPNSLRGFALERIRNLMWVLFPPGIILTVFVGIAQSIRRLRYGAALDQTLKLGSGVSKQEVQQRFLGKCWQLPFCRDYVRQRCPIYHARRTCWREGVGCMCEEKNIVMALQNVRLSDDPQKNAKYIPHNKTLTRAELRARCSECVIYNEHQRQKYQLIAPLTVGSIIGIAYFFHVPLREKVFTLLSLLDQLLARFTLMPSEAQKGVLEAAARANETAALVLYIALVIVALSYALRVVETVIFKWKL